MIAYIIFILLFNVLDYFVTRFGKKPNYTKYNLLKATAGIAIAFIWMMDFTSWTSFFVSGVVAALFELTSFWLIYPEVRNLWAKKPFLYYDVAELDSGKTDLFFSKHPKLYIPAKILAALGMGATGVIIYYA